MKSSVIVIKRVRPLLGTFVEIELRAAADEEFIQRCITRGFKAIEQIDRLMSVHRMESEISQLNRRPAGRWMRLHPLTVKVLSAANAFQAESGGVFNIVCPSKNGPRTAAPRLEIQESQARKSGPGVLDLGGIAKGFAVDHAVACLRQLMKGRKVSGIVNAGGDLRVWGDTPQRLTVRLDGASPSYGSSLKAAHMAVATSASRNGASERLTTASYWRADSPVRWSRPRAVTVFADTCLVADALTKIVLLGTPIVAERCLSAYGARAVVYSKNGKSRKVLR